MMEKDGFTLIELLVVVAIIGILAAVGTVAYNGYTMSAKISATKGNHTTLTKMIGAKSVQCNMGEKIHSIAEETNLGSNTRLSKLRPRCYSGKIPGYLLVD